MSGKVLQFTKSRLFLWISNYAEDNCLNFPLPIIFSFVTCIDNIVKYVFKKIEELNIQIEISIVICNIKCNE